MGIQILSPLGANLRISPQVLAGIGEPPLVDFEKRFEDLQNSRVQRQKWLQDIALAPVEMEAKIENNRIARMFQSLNTRANLLQAGYDLSPTGEIVPTLETAISQKQKQDYYNKYNAGVSNLEQIMLPQDNTIEMQDIPLLQQVVQTPPVVQEQVIPPVVSQVATPAIPQTQPDQYYAPDALTPTIPSTVQEQANLDGLISQGQSNRMMPKQTSSQSQEYTNLLAQRDLQTQRLADAQEAGLDNEAQAAQAKLTTINARIKELKPSTTEKTFVVEKPDGERINVYGTRAEAEAQGKIIGATTRMEITDDKKELNKELRKVNIPDFKVADPFFKVPTPETARKFETTYSSYKTIAGDNGFLSKLKEIVEDVGTEIAPTEAKARMQALYAQYKLDYKEIYGLGALQQGEIDLLDEILKDPTKFLSYGRKGDVLAVLDDFQNRITDKVYNDAITFGYKPNENSSLGKYAQSLAEKQAQEVQGQPNNITDNVIDFNDF